MNKQTMIPGEETRDAAPRSSQRDHIVPPSSPKYAAHNAVQLSHLPKGNHQPPQHPRSPHHHPQSHFPPHSPLASRTTTPPYFTVVGQSFGCGPLLVPQPLPSTEGFLFNSKTSSQKGIRPLSLSPSGLRRSIQSGGLAEISVGTMPSLEPPRISEMHAAMDTAAMAERQRAKVMEENEKDLTADELRDILKRERHRAGKLASDLARYKQATVQCQMASEVLEEGRINDLMRRLEALQIEKGRIIQELEREEEMLTNTMQKKLDQVRREKAQLEKALHDEQVSPKSLRAHLANNIEGVATVPDLQPPVGNSSVRTFTQAAEH